MTYKTLIWVLPKIKIFRDVILCC